MNTSSPVLVSLMLRLRHIYSGLPKGRVYSLYIFESILVLLLLG
jgi:hypothetical protein